MILIHPEQMRNLLVSAAVVATRTTAMMMGQDKDMMLQKQAYARYGNKTVKRWHKAGLLHPKRVDRCVYFPAIELLIASQSEMMNRLSPMASDEILGYKMEEAKQEK